MARILYFLVGIAGVMSLPLDEPIRIDLPVYEQPRATSNIILTEPLEPENHPGSMIVDKVTNILSNKINPEHPGDGSAIHGGLFSPPATKIESAVLESEGYGSKILSVKENAQNIVAGIFQPKPIVDTIKEEEKYGNDGDKFRDAGRAIVGGAESFSNFFNSIIEVPGKIIRSITRAATEKLNNLGSKIIGL